MGKDSGLKQALENVVEMSNRAVSNYPQDGLSHLQAMFVANSLLNVNIIETAKSIVEATKTNSNENVSPLISMIACLILQEDHMPYIDWFRKWEAKKYTSVLPGCSDAIIHLLNRDEENLVSALDLILLAHNKEANIRYSHIYNSYHAFLSLAPYLILRVAEYYDMDVRSKITENKQ